MNARVFLSSARKQQLFIIRIVNPLASADRNDSPGAVIPMAEEVSPDGLALVGAKDHATALASSGNGNNSLAVAWRRFSRSVLMNAARARSVLAYTSRS